MNHANLTSEALMRLILQALADKKGEAIMAFDMRIISPVTDYYVVATGLNAPHLKALFNETRLRLKNHGLACWRKSGTPDSGWVVADYLDVVVHLLTPEARVYYALDELWKAAPQIRG